MAQLKLRRYLICLVLKIAIKLLPGISQLVIRHLNVSNSTISRLFHRFRTLTVLLIAQDQLNPKEPRSVIWLRRLQDQFTTAMSTIRELEVSLQQQYPNRKIREMCQSMRPRQEAVVRSYGGHTRYK